MKNSNLPVLLIVIAVVAIVAQFTRQSGEKPEWKRLREDMSSSLTLLWERPGHEVELVPAAEGVDAHVSVRIPTGLRSRQQRWNYPFLRFVAARHPSVHLKNLTVVDAGNQRPIPETAMAGLFADRVAPRVDFADEEERLCQLTARQLTSALERRLGPGHQLVLVDAELARSQADPVKYGRRASFMAQPVSTHVLVSEICIVVDRDVPAADWEKFKTENSIGSGIPFRVVSLTGF